MSWYFMKRQSIVYTSWSPKQVGSLLPHESQVSLSITVFIDQIPISLRLKSILLVFILQYIRSNRAWLQSLTTFYNAGWWFGSFFHILGIMIPIDELIFFRGVVLPPTRMYWNIISNWWFQTFLFSIIYGMILPID